MTLSADGCAPWGACAVELLRGMVRGAPPALDKVVVASELDGLEAAGLDSLYFLAFDDSHPRQLLFDAVWARQRAACEEVQAAASAAGIECLLFKGAAHLDRWFGGRALGCMTDVDLLVRRSDAVRIIPILYSLGYQPGYLENGRLLLRDVQEIGAHEAEHYELVPYNRLEAVPLSEEVVGACQSVRRPALSVAPTAITMRVELDVHHGVASDVDANGLFTRAVTAAGFRTFSDADHVWFGLSRLYAEVALHGKTSLRDLAYLGPIVARGDIDWDVVLDYAREYELRPGLYYFLSFLDDLADGPVPPTVLAELHPANGARHRDWGWQLGKLLGGLDPPPRLEPLSTRRSGRR